MVTGAEALIESLKREHVTEIFGYAGATICPAVDAVKNSDIHYTLVRTEQNAGHMASGYSRMSGKTGVCMVTSGPGATNLVTGIATAYMDSIPMVAITGQVQSYLLGRDIFQEVDMTGAVAPFIKHSYLVKNVKDIPRIVKEAFHIASTGRPGPVLIDIPIDVQQAEFEPEYPDTVDIRGYKPSVKGNIKQIQRAAEAIRNAKKPVLCLGGGVVLAGAQKEALEFAERSSLPIVTTMMGLGIVPTDHPLYMGMIGSFGTETANRTLAHSDLLILVGARVANRAILSPGEIGRRMKTIHIDVDPAEIGKNVSTTIPVVGDVKQVLLQLMEHDATAQTQDLELLQKSRREELVRELPAKAGFAHPARVIRTLGEKLDDNACIVADVGQNQIWTCKHMIHKHGRFLTTGGLGTMGYSLPAALGAKVADPDRQTVVVCGDGSFQMFMNELSTLRNLNADVKIVMMQNDVLGLVNEIQHSSYSGPFGVALEHSPDFCKLSEAYGVDWGYVSQDRDIPAAIDTMLSHKGPYLLICRVDPDARTGD
ncbi:MAG: biosynthetic-type acetolactate synthase large subunit [Oscillospiraceae bacterium]|nr:biosynthetic-type acetolactate synthase large subunit [Oscillospiraceae bacterium]